MLQRVCTPQEKRRQSQKVFLAWFGSVPIGCAVVLYGNSISATLSPAMIVILGVVIFVSLGFWLYLIRLHFRVVYGLAEITFAVFTGLIAIAEHLNYTSILWWLPLSSAGFIGKIFAAYYVAVRALDNVANGLREHESYYRKKGDEWWEKFWHRAARLWDFISFKD